MCLSIQIMGETLQERFLPTRPLPQSTRQTRLVHASTACGATKHICTCERALVDRVKVYVYAFTVHAMLQASHHPDHSTACVPYTTGLSTTSDIAHKHATCTCPNYAYPPSKVQSTWENLEASQSHWLSHTARSTYSNLPSIAPRGGQASYCVKAHQRRS
jgi:hypothetical protein